ncbi:MAG: hypothetical protein DMG56_12160 [Acidobacteria bacterium]|nr:MAG: hypothetical protein DMG56_12160 [Acidobacteriota bacterium]
MFCPAEDAQVLFAAPPRLTPRSTVGSGDSALAGIAQAISSGASADEALRLGASCAAANCLADSPGRCPPRAYPSLSKGDSRADPRSWSLKLRYFAKFC